jgi:hypothetical protein
MRAALVTLTMCLLALPGYAKYSGGTGEPNDPYQIATAADLIALGETPEDYDKHFLLTADIDLDPNLPGREVFDKAVIGPDTDPTNYYLVGTCFTGVFNGNGHVISHVTMRGTRYLGLFGEQRGQVKNLGVKDVNITGSSSQVGGLAGSNSGHATQCYSTGVVSGKNQVGGLVGANAGVVTHCYSTGAVTGDALVGGLVGGNLSGGYNSWYGNRKVKDCYSTGPVNGTGSDVGGLVGGGDEAGVINCFWDVQTSGQATSDGGAGKTTAEMQDPNTFMAVGWDFTGQPDGPHDIWAEPAGGGYPILWWQLSPLPPLPRFSGGRGEPNEPFLISTPTELNSIGHNPRLMGAHFELANDIDLAGSDFYVIGAEFCPFTGSFNGNGHAVSHLTIRGTDYLGLFGRLEGEVTDLGIIDANIVGSGQFVGGLAGYNSGAVTRCHSTRTLSTAAVHVGGLVGYNTGQVTQCYSTGASSGNIRVGGLVGGNIACITECYSTGVVSGKDSVGGLAGFSCGGVTRCYSTGPVSGSSSVGGLVGSNYSAKQGRVIASFWDTETSGQTISAGGTGKTTTEMQTAKTFLDAGWDFVGETANGTADIWRILEGKDYPRLWWELPASK